MKNCILTKHHGYRIKGYLKGIVENKFNDSEINLIREDTWYVYNLNLKPCFECIHCCDYLFYKELLVKYFNGDMSKKILDSELAKRNMEKLFNEIFTHYPNDNENIPSNRENFKGDKEKIYLDQNIISMCVNDKNFKEYILFLKNKNYQFIYSPSHIEEIFKIKQKEDQEHFMNSIREITDNILCVKHGLDYIFVREDPVYSIKRIELYNGTTQAIEECKIITSKDRDRYLEKYNIRKHKIDLGKKEEKDDILNDLNDEDFSELMTYSYTYKFKVKNDFKNIKSGNDFLHAIYTLSHALELLGYKIDKGERVIKSGVHDIEHLIYGAYSNYFVTNDDNFRLRAHQIYKFLGIKTKILNRKEFEDAFKNTESVC